MLTGKEDILRALIEAYLMEKGTKEFYEEASRKVRQEVAREAFGELSHWEEEHMLYVQHLYQALQGEREPLSFEAFKARAKAERLEGGMPIPEAQERLQERLSFLDDLGALTLALEIEGRAFALYSRLQRDCPEPSVAALFGELKHWEQEHIRYLKSLRSKFDEGP